VSPADPAVTLPAAEVRDIRDTLMHAARDALYRIHHTEAPRYIARARSLNRSLVAAARAARGASTATGSEVIA
jgi:hypothetical protein